jgi:hypothetical protein
MSSNSYRLAGCLATVLALVAAGCGSGGEQQEMNRWVNEFVLANGSFQRAAKKGKQRIASAKTRPDLEAAYRSYAKAQQEQIARVERLEPPPACEDEQVAIERFMHTIAHNTEELSHQSSLTPQSLKGIEADIYSASTGLVTRLRSLAEKESC